MDSGYTQEKIGFPVLLLDDVSSSAFIENNSCLKIQKVNKHAKITSIILALENIHCYLRYRYFTFILHLIL